MLPGSYDVALFGDLLFDEKGLRAWKRSVVSSAGVRSAYETAVGGEREERKHLLRRLSIDEIAISTPDNVVHPLIKFFRTRETRARRR